MKRFFALALVAALVGLGVPAPLAAAQQTGSLAGIAKDNGGNPLGNYTVRLRNVASGQLVGTGKTAADGAFTFSNLQAGNYVIEIVDAAGKVIATSASIPLAAGAALTGVVVTASAASAAAIAGAAGAGSFFTSTGGIVLLAAVGVGVTAGIVKATGSPSK
jgi:hypothetical protein